MWVGLPLHWLRSGTGYMTRDKSVVNSLGLTAWCGILKEYLKESPGEYSINMGGRSINQLVRNYKEAKTKAWRERHQEIVGCCFLSLKPDEGRRAGKQPHTIPLFQLFEMPAYKSISPRSSSSPRLPLYVWHSSLFFTSKWFCLNYLCTHIHIQI